MAGTWHERPPNTFARRRAVVRANRRGLTAVQIGIETDLHPATVRKILRREGERPNPTPAPVPPEPPRPIFTPTFPEAVLGYLVARGPRTAPDLALELGNPEDYARALSRVQQALHRHRRRGRVRSWAARAAWNVVLWLAAERLPMTLDDAQAMVRRGVPFGDVYPHLGNAEREQLRQWFVACVDGRCEDNGLPNLTARHASPVGTAEVCARCGAAAVVWAGACKQCRACGDSSGGCG